MATIPLNTSASVTLDGSGNGTAKLSPPLGVTWNIAVASVITTTATNIPVCKIFMGGNPVDSNFIDGTYTGSQDSTDRVSAFPLTNGQNIFAVWTGGDSGAIATLSISGTAVTP